MRSVSQHCFKGCYRLLSTASLCASYEGFEQGPIRPPSEHASLKLRVSRNCPWNQCTFCPVYKGKRFSLRSVEDLKQDIDRVAAYIDLGHAKGDLADDDLRCAADQSAAFAAYEWMANGMKDVFLQDANALLMNPSDLLQVLQHLKHRFPSVRRITSYARSHTLARLPESDLRALRDAGLNRVHIGFESGSDRVLKRVRKGATQAIHIKAGQKVKQAGIELSVYIMPGLGGEELSEEHAKDSAEAVNQTNPDFVRIRSLILASNMKLHEEMEIGLFRPLSERAKVAELGLFVEHLQGITSMLKSNDHSMNLLAEADGKLPQDKGHILEVIRSFTALSPEEQVLFQIGRRAGLMRGMHDLTSYHQRSRAQAIVDALGATPDNVDHIAQLLVACLDKTFSQGRIFHSLQEVVVTVQQTLQQEAGKKACQ